MIPRRCITSNIPRRQSLKNIVGYYASGICTDYNDVTVRRRPRQYVSRNPFLSSNSISTVVSNQRRQQRRIVVTPTSIQTEELLDLLYYNQRLCMSPLQEYKRYGSYINSIRTNNYNSNSRSMDTSYPWRNSRQNQIHSVFRNEKYMSNSKRSITIDNNDPTKTTKTQQSEQNLEQNLDNKSNTSQSEDNTTNINRTIIDKGMEEKKKLKLSGWFDRYVQFRMDMEQRFSFTSDVIRYYSPVALFDFTRPMDALDAKTSVEYIIDIEQQIAAADAAEAAAAASGGEDVFQPTTKSWQGFKDWLHQEYTTGDRWTLTDDSVIGGYSSCGLQYIDIPDDYDYDMYKDDDNTVESSTSTTDTAEPQSVFTRNTDETLKNILLKKNSTNDDDKNIVQDSNFTSTTTETDESIQDEKTNLEEEKQKQQQQRAPKQDTRKYKKKFVPFLRWYGNIDCTVGLQSADNVHRSGFVSICSPDYTDFFGDGADVRRMYNAIEIVCRASSILPKSMTLVEEDGIVSTIPTPATPTPIADDNEYDDVTAILEENSFGSKTKNTTTNTGEANDNQKTDNQETSALVAVDDNEDDEYEVDEYYDDDDGELDDYYDVDEHRTYSVILEVSTPKPVKLYEATIRPSEMIHLIRDNIIFDEEADDYYQIPIESKINNMFDAESDERREPIDYTRIYIESIDDSPFVQIIIPINHFTEVAGTYSPPEPLNRLYEFDANYVLGENCMIESVSVTLKDGQDGPFVFDLARIRLVNVNNLVDVAYNQKYYNVNDVPKFNDGLTIHDPDKEDEEMFDTLETSWIVSTNSQNKINAGGRKKRYYGKSIQV